METRGDTSHPAIPLQLCQGGSRPAPSFVQTFQHTENQRRSRSAPASQRRDTERTFDEGECPSCGSMTSIHVFAYWPERDDFIRVCTHRHDGDARRICGYMWINSEPYAMCTCRQRMTIEPRFGIYYYVCSTCKSIGFDTIHGSGPPHGLGAAYV